MTLRPEALDYEGLFRRKNKPARDDESFRNNLASKTESSTSSTHNQTSLTINANSKEIGTFQPSSSIGERESPLDPAVSTEGKTWVARRGHTLTFVGLFLFSVILYIRPYEFFPALSSFKSMAFYTGLVTLVIYAFNQLSTDGNLTAQPKEINLVLLLGVAAILSIPLAVSPADAWKTFSEMLLKTIIIFVVIVNVVRTELRLKLLLLLVLAVSIYLSVNAINDYRHGLFQVGALETYDARIVGRIKGLFENSNDLAMHLVTMIPIAVGLGLGGRGLFRKLVYFAGSAIMVGAVIVTFSRGGFLGLVAAVLVMVRRLGRKNRVATTGALVLAFVLFLALAPGAYSSRLSTIFDSSADLTASSSQRTEVFKRSVRVALRYPLFGVGIGNFPHKSPRNLASHNAYTQVAAEMGMAAMVIYIMFLVHPLRRLRLVENESFSKPDRGKFYYLSVGLQASLVGFMVSSFFGSVAYHWYVYYLVGYAVCLHRLFLMKFPPADVAARTFWEHPFAKRSERLIQSERASQLGHP
jgi:O-antigen ligase